MPVDGAQISRNVTTNRYDAVGRMVEQESPAYTAPGSATEIRAKKTVEYNAVGQVISTTDPRGNITIYAYDDGSPWPTTVTSAGGVVTRAKYNSVGEPFEVTDGAGNKTKTVYDSAGRAVKTIAPDNTYSTVSYDFGGRAVSASEYSAAGAPLRTRSQEYDASGNPVKVKDARDTIKTFEYDVLGQLVRQSEPITTSDAIVTRFGYDLPGGRRGSSTGVRTRSSPRTTRGV